MVTIIRHEVNESLAISGVVETRGLVFVSYCLGNIGKPIEEQINGAFDNLSERLKEGANKQVISSQADSLIKISRIWADFFPANTSNQPI
ncbi:RidA family protein [Klebsiella pneumoniae]|uniref:RidA family protein n=1 Tax=Klebsiella pneumoniae TaxID=573 RepID=UPI00344B083F